MHLSGYPWRVAVVAFVLGLAVGGAGARYHCHQAKVAGGEPVAESMLLHAGIQERTEIAYVPKAAGESAAVEVNAAAPRVAVSVNGRPAAFETLPGETRAFEKGKLVITEETQLKLDIKTPRPRLYAGLGAGSNGLALTLGGRLSGEAGWWLYGDRRTVAGGVQVPVRW
jgi:hypothetical protein